MLFSLYKFCVQIPPHDWPVKELLLLIVPGEGGSISMRPMLSRGSASVFLALLTI